MIRSYSAFRNNETSSGFTLIELMVALAVSAIVLLAVTQFFLSANKAATIQEKVSGTQQEIRAVMEMITRDIRMAGLNPSGNAGCAGFDGDNTDENSIGILYDHDGDGTCDVTIRYFLDGNTLMMDNDFTDTNTDSEEPLSSEGSIASLEFEYLPSDDADAIRVVRLTIEGQITGAYAEDSISSLHFTNTVKARNR